MDSHDTTETGLSREISAKECQEGYQSANQVIATIFWNVHNIICFNYHNKRKPINHEDYTSLVKRFNDCLKRKRLHLRKKKVVVHQENDRLHSA